MISIIQRYSTRLQRVIRLITNEWTINDASQQQRYLQFYYQLHMAKPFQTIVDIENAIKLRDRANRLEKQMIPCGNNRLELWNGMYLDWKL